MTAPVLVDDALLADLVERARVSPRGRMNLNLHAMDDVVHRMLNATEPRTYVQPHRHLSPPRHETLTVVHGRGAVVCFDDAGTVTDVVRLGAGEPTRVVELPAGCWHTLLAFETGTVWLEAKAGPYVPCCAADRASWAPAETAADGAREAAHWLAELRESIGLGRVSDCGPLADTVPQDDTDPQADTDPQDDTDPQGDAGRSGAAV